MIVRESLLEFKRGREVKKTLGVGLDRFRKPGDTEINDLFLRRDSGDNRPILTIVRRSDGKEFEVGLFAAKEVIKALKELT